MSLPYFNLYPTDFEADTSHLTLEEDGAYNRLLRLMWMTPGCSLPNDEKWIMRRMRVTPDDFERVVAVVIEEFFRVKAGRIYSPRLTEEWEKTSEARERRISAGSKGGKAKALKNNKPKPSNALALTKQPEPEPEPNILPPSDDGGSSEQLDLIPKAPKPKKRRQAFPEDWSPDDRQIEWARARGHSPQEIDRMARHCVDHHRSKGTVFADHAAAFRTWVQNQERYASRGGQSPPSSSSGLSPQAQAIMDRRRARQD